MKYHIFIILISSFFSYNYFIFSSQEIRVNHPSGGYASIKEEQSRTPIQKELIRQQRKVTDENLLYGALLQDAEYREEVTRLLNEVIAAILIANHPYSLALRVEGRLKLFRFALVAFHGDALEKALMRLQKYFDEETGDLINASYDKRFSETIEPFLQSIPSVYIPILEVLKDEASREFIDQYNDSFFKNAISSLVKGLASLPFCFTAKKNYIGCIRKSNYNEQLFELIFACKEHNFKYAEKIHRVLIGRNRSRISQMVYEEYYIPYYEKNFDIYGICRTYQEDDWWKELQPEEKKAITYTSCHREFVEHILAKKRTSKYQYGVINAVQQKAFIEECFRYEPETARIIKLMSLYELENYIKKWSKNLEELLNSHNLQKKSDNRSIIPVDRIKKMLTYANTLIDENHCAIGIELLWYTNGLIEIYCDEKVDKFLVLQDITLKACHKLIELFSNHPKQHSIIQDMQQWYVECSVHI